MCQADCPDIDAAHLKLLKENLLFILIKIFFIIRIDTKDRTGWPYLTYVSDNIA